MFLLYFLIIQRVHRHVTLNGYAWLYVYLHFTTCGIAQVAHVVTVAFRERRTVSAVVVWISPTVINAGAT